MKGPPVYISQIGFLVIIQVIINYFVLNLNHLQFVDADCYMRLVRVEQLFNTGDWYDAVIQRSNWPYGETLHWSRMLDLILILGAYLGTFFVDFNTSLFWWGMFVSPLLHILCLVSLIWAAGAKFNGDARVRLGFLFIGQMGIWVHCYIGRPDHHSLLLCLFFLLFGCCMRMVDQRYDRRYNVYAGLLAATGMWVSVEAIAAVFMMLGLLVILWINKVDNIVAKGQDFSLTLLLCSAIYIVAEFPPTRVWEVFYDKLSLVHVAIFFLSALFWLHMRWVTYRSSGQRLGIVVIFSCIAGVILQQYFPQLFMGPYATIDPRIIPIWLSTVQEIQPLLDFSQRGVGKMILYLTPVTICLPYMLYKGIYKRQTFTAEWLVYGVGMGIYIPLALYQVRWAAYAEVVMLFPTVFILQKILDKLASIRGSSWRVIGRALVTVIFCVGAIIVSHLVMPAENAGKNITATKIATFLNDPSGVGILPKTIVTDLYFGPEILYRTSHQVIGTPYHRNGDGIMFVHDVLKAQNDEEAYQMLYQRDVDLILLCPETMGHNFEENSLYSRLLKGQYPAWIAPMELPAELQGDWFLYQVMRKKNDE